MDSTDRTALDRAFDDRLIWGFPTPFSEYSGGAPLTARTHVVLGGMGTESHFQDLQETLIKATVTARLGDGVAVTPCPDDFTLTSIDPNIVLNINCDYEASYSTMIESIIERAANAICDNTTNIPKR